MTPAGAAVENEPVAMITGGGTGIGAATARLLAAAGWRVAVVGRRQAPLERVAIETGALAIAADASDERQIERAVSCVQSTYGRLDGLVLSAGVIRPGRVAELAVEAWRATIETNLTGPFLLTRAALPLLLQNRGAIVAVGSIGACVTGPASAAYGASKAGLIRLIRSIAVDYGPQGVRANAVNPGWVRSEMADAEMDALGRVHGVDREAAYRLVTEHVPSRRAATSEEAAAAIRWLLSPDATYVNGAVITVDGGTSVVSAGALAFEQPSGVDG